MSLLHGHIFPYIVSTLSCSMVVCLRETHVLPKRDLHHHGYTSYHMDNMNGSRAHGGVAVLVHKSVYFEEIVLNSALQVINTRVILALLNFTVCFLYLPSCDNISTTISDLFSELPHPFNLSGN